jgi:hypothetical protein
MRCTTARFGSQKKIYCFLHLLYAVCRNLIDHCQAHLPLLRSPVVSKGSSRIDVLLFVLAMLEVSFVDCVHSACSMAWNLQNAVPWKLSVWKTGSVPSHSSRGLVVPSTFTGAQLEARTWTKAPAVWTDFNIAHLTLKLTRPWVWQK